MQSLLILPLQRERTWGEEGVGGVTAHCEGKSNSNTLDMRGRECVCVFVCEKMAA